MRTIGRRVVAWTERLLGDGPYARIYRLELKVQKLERQVGRQSRQLVHVKGRSRERREQIESLKKQLERARRRKGNKRPDEGQRDEAATQSLSEGATVQGLLDTAWGGWWDYGKRELEGVIQAATSTEGQVFDAHVALAELARAEAEIPAELAHLQAAARQRFPNPPGGHLLLHLAHLRLSQGQPDAGRRLLRSVNDESYFVEKRLLDFNLAQASARTPGLGVDSVPSPIDATPLSQIFERFQLCGVEIARVSEGDAFPAIAPARPVRGMAGPTVSIIVPAFNCIATLASTIASMTQQSWEALEIVIVDDASDDGTASVARALATTDSRIKVVGHSTNLGAYGARNTGLAHSNGEFITVCDAGDWIHPQRIELQVLDLLRSGHPWNWSQLVRADSSLRFRPRSRGLGRFVHDNPSSLMFHRSVFDACGSWDSVRVSGDTEFRTRVLGVTGLAPRRVVKGCPLSFALVEQHSLTQRRATRDRSRYRGVRREYLDSVKDARRAAVKEAQQHLRGAVDSPLVVKPGDVRVDKTKHEPSFDAVLVADFSDGSCEAGILARLVNRVNWGAVRLGLVHVPSVVGCTSGPSAWSRQFAARIGSTWIAPGKRVNSTVTLTTDSLPLWNGGPIDEFPSVVARRIWVIGRSHITDGNFSCVVDQDVIEALVAHFPIPPDQVRFIGDVGVPVVTPAADRELAWGGRGGSSGVDVAVARTVTIESIILGKRRNPVESDSDLPLRLGSRLVGALRVLGCQRCVSPSPDYESDISMLGTSATDLGRVLEVPPHHVDNGASSRLMNQLIAWDQTTDESSTETTRSPRTLGSLGVYWPQPVDGTPHCWDPMTLSSAGLPIIHREFASSGEEMAHGGSGSMRTVQDVDLTVRSLIGELEFSRSRLPEAGMGAR